jgi:hypothetical protein
MTMHLPRLFTGVILSLPALAACSSSDDFVLVTVSAQPAVHDVTSLTVALSNGGTTRMDSLALRDRAFPVTFSISAPGRSGDLAIAIDAIDGAGLVVGHGSAATTTVAPDAIVALDATDFVVNTDFASDQYPADDFEASGFQVAALADGTWTAAFRDSCLGGSCSIFARRFDKLGRPVQSAVSASANAFTLTTAPTTFASTPAIAAGTTTTIAVWDAYTPSPGTGQGVACRALDSAGRATPNQLSVAPDAADVVSVAALSDGNFVASWDTLPAAATDRVIHSVLIKPDCTPAGAVQTVSTLVGSAHRGAVATSADRALFVWIVAGDLHARMMSNTGAFTTTDTILVPKTATEEIMHARVAGVAGGGFVIAVRWAQSTLTSGPGRIDLVRVSPAGSLVAAPTLVTDKSATDFDNREAFSIASRTDGTVLVAWHTCGALGDDHMCGVFGRVVRDNGVPVTDVFVLPTTTDGDQKLPSVVGLPDSFVALWTDASAKPPDVAGLAARARIIY